MTSAQASRAAFEARAARRAQAIVAQRAEKERQAGGQDAGAAAQSADPARPPAPPQFTAATAVERQNFLKEVRARLDAALDAEIGFAERLVWFWSNHFCVSAATVPNMAGGYEREAIRPHVLGRFADMLLAVEGHPAMLVYLNNPVSIGPNSVAGINRTRGLNENLAREILELHTLGVRTGYSQDDVTRFAKVLTGWTVISADDNPEHGAEFIFNRACTSPDRSRSSTRPTPTPASSRAARCWRISPAIPPPRRMSRPSWRAISSPTIRRRRWSSGWPRRFRDTDGDLKEVAKALVTAPEAWSPPQAKLKRPSEWVVAMVRAIGLRGDPERLRAVRHSSASRSGGRRRRRASPTTKAPGSTAGTAARHRQQFRPARRRAGRPAAVVETALGPLASAETRAAVARAESRQQASRWRSWRPNSNGGDHATPHLSTRRDLLLGSGALFAWAYAPSWRAPKAATRASWSSCCAARSTGSPWSRRSAIPAGSTCAATGRSCSTASRRHCRSTRFFALNPAMPNLHRLYQAEQATIVHAAATPYRERSHFDGQDVLESGLAKPGATDSGWLNRALSSLEPGWTRQSAREQGLCRRAGDAARRARPRAGDVMGAAAAAPGERRHPDAPARPLPPHRPQARARARRPSRTRRLARAGGMDTMRRARAKPPAAGMARVRAYFADDRRRRGEIPGAARRPARRRAGFVGWDTHVNEGAAEGRLAALLGALDGALAAIEKAMGEAWSETVVALVTEFGRTARINGTDGTDHGTGTVALLAGGALKGGRVIADWPGLKPADLHESRDLKPTTDLRAVLKGVLKDHLRVDERALDATVFPASDDVKPMAGLFA